MPALEGLREALVAGAPGALRAAGRPRPLRRPAAHPLGPLRPPHAKDRPEPLTAYAHPVLDRRFPRGTRILARRRARPPGRGLRGGRAARPGARLPVRRRQALPRLPGPRAALGPRPRRAATAARFENRTRFLREIVAGIRAEAPGPRRSACASPSSTPCPSARRPTAWACRRRRPRATARPSACSRTSGSTRPSTTPARSSGCSRRWASAGLRHRREPLLQPAHPAPRALPAHRRLPAAGGPAARRGAADRGHRAPQGRAFPGSSSWARPTAICRNGCPTWRSAWCATAAPTSWASAAWSCPIRSCPPTCWPGSPLRRKGICRTFSDCTSAPRNGLVSGCFPLDPFYVNHPDAERLRQAKAALPV